MPNQTAQDLLGQDIAVGDFVVSYNQIYQILEILPRNQVRVILVKKSKTTRAVIRDGFEVCKVDGHLVTIWLLKNARAVYEH